jgi:hypothetical protein
MNLSLDDEIYINTRLSPHSVYKCQNALLIWHNHLDSGWYMYIHIYEYNIPESLAIIIHGFDMSHSCPMTTSHTMCRAQMTKIYLLC